MKLNTDKYDATEQNKIRRSSFIHDQDQDQGQDHKITRSRSRVYLI